jgi:hypothetical protein
LVEVALSVAITAVALLAILGLFSNGLQSSRGVANNTIAAAIGQNLIHQFQSQSMIGQATGAKLRFAYCKDVLLTLNCTTPVEQVGCYDAEGNPLGNNPTDPKTTFEATCNIAAESTDTPPLYNLTVVVKWPLPGRANTMTFTTLVSFP